jgi:hypothetical protein
MLRYKVVRDIGNPKELDALYYKKHWWSPWEYFGSVTSYEQLEIKLAALRAYRDKYTISTEGKL